MILVLKLYCFDFLDIILTKALFALLRWTLVSFCVLLSLYDTSELCSPVFLTWWFMCMESTVGALMQIIFFPGWCTDQCTLYNYLANHFSWRWIWVDDITIWSLAKSKSFKCVNNVRMVWFFFIYLLTV